MDTLLKDMLMSLQQSLHTDITSLFQKFSAEVSSLGERVNLVENAVNNITTTVNNLVDANDDGIEERQWLRAKIADLEDRSRQNNLVARHTKVSAVSRAKTICYGPVPYTPP